MAKLLCVVLLFSIISAAFSIKCYNCYSKINGICDENHPSFGYSAYDCNILTAQTSIQYKTCVTMIIKDQSNEESIQRGCSIHSDPYQCDGAVELFVKTLKARDAHCYACDTDLCNHSLTWQNIGPLEKDNV